MGKRETQRRHTRSLLRKQALRRFQKDGFQRTSVADIAADAGVTERTFYRHFTSKEAVLFEDHETRFEWFRAALDVRPFDEPILDAVQVAVESFPDGREVVSQVAELRSRVLSEEAIEGHLLAAQGDFSAEIEHHLKTRLGDSEEDELRAAVMSRAIAAALVAALDVWTRRAGGDPDDLRELTRQALDHLRHDVGSTLIEGVAHNNNFTRGDSGEQTLPGGAGNHFVSAVRPSASDPPRGQRGRPPTRAARRES